MAKLSAYDKAYITGNVDKLKPREIAAHLLRPTEVIRKYLRENSLTSICKIYPSAELTEGEKKYIRENSSSISMSELARELKCTIHRINKLVKAENLPHNQLNKRKLVDLYVPPQKFERPPAVYSNKAW